LFDLPFELLQKIQQFVVTFLYYTKTPVRSFPFVGVVVWVYALGIKMRGAFVTLVNIVNIGHFLQYIY